MQQNFFSKLSIKKQILIGIILITISVFFILICILLISTFILITNIYQDFLDYLELQETIEMTEISNYLEISYNYNIKTTKTFNNLLDNYKKNIEKNEFFFPKPSLNLNEKYSLFEERFTLIPETTNDIKEFNDLGEKEKKYIILYDSSMSSSNKIEIMLKSYNIFRLYSLIFILNNFKFQNGYDFIDIIYIKDYKNKLTFISSSENLNEDYKSNNIDLLYILGNTFNSSQLLSPIPILFENDDFMKNQFIFNSYDNKRLENIISLIVNFNTNIANQIVNQTDICNYNIKIKALQKTKNESLFDSLTVFLTCKDWLNYNIKNTLISTKAIPVLYDKYFRLYEDNTCKYLIKQFEIRNQLPYSLINKFNFSDGVNLKYFHDCFVDKEVLNEILRIFYNQTEKYKLDKRKFIYEIFEGYINNSQLNITIRTEELNNDRSLPSILLYNCDNDIIKKVDINMSISNISLSSKIEIDYNGYKKVENSKKRNKYKLFKSIFNFDSLFKDYKYNLLLIKAQIEIEKDVNRIYHVYTKIIIIILFYSMCIWLITFIFILYFLIKISNSLTKPINLLTLSIIEINSGNKDNIIQKRQMLERLKYKDDYIINELFKVCKKLILGNVLNKPILSIEENGKIMRTDYTRLIKENNYIFHEKYLFGENKYEIPEFFNYLHEESGNNLINIQENLCENEDEKILCNKKLNDEVNKYYSLDLKDNFTIKRVFELMKKSYINYDRYYRSFNEITYNGKLLKSD